MTAKAPNILLIQADQMAAPALPFYGHPVVKAPHMSALAEAGIVFECAYCNAPLCAPSRFSMLSGLMPSEIAAYDNAAEFPATVPTFVHHLRSLGYRTVLSGKMHFVGPDQLHGFERRVTTDIYPADFGWTPDWERPGERRDFYHTMLSVAEAGPCERSLQMDFDEEVAHQGVRALYDLAREGGAAGARPFFLQVSFTHPHDPYTITREYWDRYDDAEIDPPRVPAMAREALDPHSRRVFDACGMAEYDLNEARVRAARRAYYGAISYIDDQVGRLMAALKSARLDDDTIVILTGDHGDMLGERGLWYKMSFYEWSARVPLVVHAPARFGARRVGRNVSLVDLYPTLVELAGGGRDPVLPGPLSGNSLVPLMTGQEEGWSDTVAGEYLGEAAAGPLVMIRRGAHKYIVGEDSPAQLFDLAADPDEVTDLAGDPSHGDLAAAFAAEAAARWDFPSLKRRVILNQRRRRFVFAAQSRGETASWDFQPCFDASRLYARNRADILGDLEREARLPYAAALPADGTGS
jgi:choline-sulfatase